jgi:hypothetical protein
MEVHDTALIVLKEETEDALLTLQTTSSSHSSRIYATEESLQELCIGLDACRAGLVVGQNTEKGCLKVHWQIMMVTLRLIFDTL